MDEFRAILEKLLDKKDLDEEEAYRAFSFLSHNLDFPLEWAVSFLTALRVKEECVSELVGGAKAMFSSMRHFPRPDGLLLDIVGTGGDGKQTLNVSTLASLVVAACGVPVAKHGNRSVSSKCGSADLLEALGFSLEVSPEEAAVQLKSLSFAFLFAPFYHQGFKRIAQVRRLLGFRTIFNLIGPLANPAHPSAMLVGVAKVEWLEKMAAALAALGCRKAWVVHGGGGSDELDLQGENQVISVNHGKIKRLSVKAEDAGLHPAPLDAIKGGSREENANLSLRVLQGEKNALRDTVALNAGAALFLAEKCATLREATALALEALEKGKAMAIIETVRNIRNIHEPS